MSSGTVVNLFMVYQFLKRLTTPFEQWSAYKEGVIDERGNIIIKAKDRHTLDQRRSFGKFDLLVLKLKRLLEKVPGGKTKLASYAAALFLIKEDWQSLSDNELEDMDVEDRFTSLFEELQEDSMDEEGPANVVGSGSIAGGGYGGPEDVKVSPKAAKRYKRKNQIEAPKINKAFEELISV